MKKFTTVVFLFMSIFNLSFAQTDQRAQKNRDEIQRQIEEIMKNRDDMIKSLFNDDAFPEMEKRMMDMMKRFSNEDLDFNSQSFFGGGIVGEYDWKEDDQFKILTLKVKQIKDQPLDIKIEKGQIKIKGDVEEVTNSNKHSKNKKVTKIHFERIFSIPAGVDEKNPEFGNTDGVLEIKFRKKMAQKSIKNKNNEERMPISPDEKDISL
jgi:HSP20 family molecular chaperone IbpA